MMGWLKNHSLLKRMLLFVDKCCEYTCHSRPKKQPSDNRMVVVIALIFLSDGKLFNPFP